MGSHLRGAGERAEQIHEGHVFLVKVPCLVPKVTSVAGWNEWGHQYMLLTILHVKQGNAFTS